MSELKSVGTIICICCVACSIISLIVPDKRMNKTVNLVLGLFLICSMIVPIKGIVSTLKGEDMILHDYDFEQNIDEDVKEYQKAVMKETADNLVKVTDNLLKNEDIQADNIKLSLKLSDNNSIYVGRIIIYISKKYEDRLNDIQKIVYSNMSKEPEIIINEQENIQ